jgi:hypothetical protein
MHSRSATLKDGEGRCQDVYWTLAQIVFESGGGFTLFDNYDFENETRFRPDGPAITGAIEARTAVEEQEGRPTFTIVNTASWPRIDTQLVTKDHLYWFKDDQFGEVKTRELSINVRSNDIERPWPAALGIWEGYDRAATGEQHLNVEIYLQEELFRRLFETISAARTPCKIYGSIKVPCFQNRIERYAPHRGPQTLMFPCGSNSPAMLGSIALQRCIVADNPC